MDRTEHHDPRQVHVFEDGQRVLKFDIVSWVVMEGTFIEGS